MLENLKAGPLDLVRLQKAQENELLYVRRE